MRRRAVGVILGAIAAVLVLAAPAPGFRNVAPGDAMPALVVEGPDGREVEITFPGRVTVALFFRPGQAFSTEALRDLAIIERTHQGKAVATLVVAERGATREDVRATLVSAGVNLPAYRDAQGRAEQALGIIVYPSTAIVGRDGRLQGYLPSRGRNHREMLEARVLGALGALSEAAVAARLREVGEEGPGGEAARELANRALGQGTAGKWDEAIASLRRALALAPDDADLHLQLGYALLEVANAKEALAEFQAVLRQNPTSPGARGGVGIAHVRLGDLDRGIRELEAAVALNPNPVRDYAELGRAYEAKGDVARAVHNYKWAVRKLLQGRR